MLFSYAANFAKASVVSMRRMRTCASLRTTAAARLGQRGEPAHHLAVHVVMGDDRRDEHDARAMRRRRIEQTFQVDRRAEIVGAEAVALDAAVLDVQDLLETHRVLVFAHGRRHDVEVPRPHPRLDGGVGQQPSSDAVPCAGTSA